ncbi:MAG: polysaccharide deacetylase family protein [Acidobacteria bacterium]|nr:polysaccharide deacetylase family protein [Acidobacteriota bacterium]
MLKKNRAIALTMLFCGLFLSSPETASAQRSQYKGPSVVAKFERGLWPEPVAGESGFDRASRAAILIYAVELEGMRNQSDEQMRSTFNVSIVNHGSVDKWIARELTHSLRNYQFASRNCAEKDWTCVGGAGNPEELVALAGKLAVPAAFRTWQDNLREFVREYLAEQLRLAAKFPRTTSEIDFFNDNEWNGDELEDRKFYLTFDDGPAGPGGTTEGVLEMLQRHKKTGVFFVLGESFQNRLNRTSPDALAGLYRGQCIGSHGWQHQSHASWPYWETSVTRTESLLQKVFGDSGELRPLFRPPYGQRKADSGDFFREQGLQVALWNLDSQDWNNQVNPEDIINRMETLMLIKRHGVLLFHDIHPKARIALPVIFEEFGSAVDWGDCRQLGGAENKPVRREEKRTDRSFGHSQLLFLATEFETEIAIRAMLLARFLIIFL